MEELYLEFDEYIRQNYDVDKDNIIHILPYDDPIDEDYLSSLVNKDYWQIEDTICDVNQRYDEDVIDSFISNYESSKGELDSITKIYLQEYFYDTFGCVDNSINNSSVDVTIIVNYGDMNYDYTCHNQLNYYCGQYDDNLNISGLAFLTKYFRCFSLYKKQIAEHQKGKPYVQCDNKLVDECIEELINLVSHIGALTFSTKLTIQEIIDLKRDISLLHEDDNYSLYYPQKGNIKDKDCKHVLINKDSMTGLFDYIYGSGSLLNINLPDDVKLPIKYIHKIIPFDGKSNGGYTINSTYGLITNFKNSSYGTEKA